MAGVPRPRPIVHINGFPGTGKLTIARILQSKLGGRERCRLVHNHLLINPADAVLHRAEPGYQDLRKSLRAAVFSSLASSEAAHNLAYVFTDFQSSDPTGSATCAEYLAAAAARGCALVSVVLSCAAEENVARLRSVERAAHGKIVDAELLEFFRKGVSIHRFGDALGPGVELELEVTQLRAEEAAEVIYRHILETCPELKSDIPLSES